MSSEKEQSIRVSISMYDFNSQNKIVSFDAFKPFVNNKPHKQAL